MSISTSVHKSVITPAQTYSPYYRINNGGALITATDGFANWQSDALAGAQSGVGFSVNRGLTDTTTGLSFTRGSQIPASLPTANFNSIFNTFKYIETASPKLAYVMGPSLPATQYQLRLYVRGNSDTTTNQMSVFINGVQKTILKPSEMFDPPYVANCWLSDIFEENSGSITLEVSANIISYIFAIELLKLNP